MTVKKHRVRTFVIVMIILVLIALVVWALITLPPLNIQASWLALVAIVLVAVFGLVKAIDARLKKENKPRSKIASKRWFYLCWVPIVTVVIINVALSPFFNARGWASRITIDTAESFSAAVSEVDFDTVPLLDRDSTEQLGDRTMGQLADYVSQFDVSSEYTQITYQGRLVRVTPIDYTDMVKWFTNRSSGTPGYIMVDSTTGASQLVKGDGGIHYTKGSFFLEDLERHIYIHYPTLIRGTADFEIDETGHPFWVQEYYSVSGVGMMKKVAGVITCDAVTGKLAKYKVGDVPAWIDNVYPASLITEEVNNHGDYQNGFWNSVFEQVGVTHLTDGYTYFQQDGDVWMYSGITSVKSDESNLGFVLVNLRTHQATYVSCPGAEEYSAMNSAKGAVQEKNYTTNFPLLINLHGSPVYMLSLKDASGLVKAYAFVSVTDYQKVSVTTSSDGIVKAARNYLQMIGDTSSSVGNTVTDEITVADISSAVISGDTYYYITASTGLHYRLAITASDLLPFVKAGDTLKIVRAADDTADVIEGLRLE